MPACLDCELSLPLVDEFHALVAKKQHWYPPEETGMIRTEVAKLSDGGIIYPSKSPCAAEFLCLREKKGTLRLFMDWRRLNSLLVPDSSGLGDM